MMNNCCDSLLKYLLFVFNFFVFLTGVGLITTGAYIHLEMSDYLNFMDDRYVNASILFMVLGAVILVIGFCGCCGACTESPCMMFTFGSLLAVVVIIEIGAAITIYLFRSEVHQVISDKMTGGLQNYQQENFDGVTKTWDAIQNDFDCCGVSNYTNWQDTPFSKETKGVPDSCCKKEEKDCGVKIFESSDPGSKIHTFGCLALLEKSVMDNVAKVGGIGLAIAILQVIGVLVACMLAGNMRNAANYV